MGTQQKIGKSIFKPLRIYRLFIVLSICALIWTTPVLTPQPLFAQETNQEELGPVLVLNSNEPTLEADADWNSVMSQGDTIGYTATIDNVGDATAAGARFLGTLDKSLTLILDSVVISQGTFESAGVSYVQGELGDVAPGTSIAIEFLALINVDNEAINVITDMEISANLGDSAPIGGQPGGLDAGVQFVPVSADVLLQWHPIFLPMVIQ